MLSNIEAVKLNRGFTLVELLIVIFVLAILVAIVILTYNGIQSRAKTSTARATANTAIKKALAYNAETANYPIISTDLTGASAATTYRLTGATFVAAMGTTPPANPISLTFYKCGTGASTTAPSTVADIIAPTGVKIDYFNYGTKTTNSVSAGVISPGGMIGTYNVGCVVNN